MAMPAIHRRWTAADVRSITREDRAWPRYEIIDGELLVTPAPRMAHQLMAFELCRLLDEFLAHEPLGVAVMSPSDLELRPGTITQPDVFVVPAAIAIPSAIADDTVQWPDVKSLLLAVEVLSPSSLRTDRVTKRDFYLDAGVEEYWIVDIEARLIERWRPMQETPELLRERMAWAPRGCEPLVIELPALFDRVEAKLRVVSR